jgi:hypothetical protein
MVSIADVRKHIVDPTNCYSRILNSLSACFGGKGQRTGTYSSIPPHLEDSLTGFSRQRLRASDHAIRTVNDAPATWELNELRVLGRIDSSRTETHLEMCVRTGRVESDM